MWKNVRNMEAEKMINIYSSVVWIWGGFLETYLPGL